MRSPLDDMFADVYFSGSEPFERDEHGLPVVIEDDPDEAMPWVEAVCHDARGGAAAQRGGSPTDS